MDTKSLGINEFMCVDRAKHPSLARFALITPFYRKAKRSLVTSIGMTMIFIITMSYHPEDIPRYCSMLLGLIGLSLVPAFSVFFYKAKLTVYGDRFELGVKNFKIVRKKISEISYFVRSKDFLGCFLVVDHTGRIIFTIYADKLPAPFEKIKIIEDERT